MHVEPINTGLQSPEPGVDFRACIGVGVCVLPLTKWAICIKKIFHKLQKKLREILALKEIRVIYMHKSIFDPRSWFEKCDANILGQLFKSCPKGLVHFSYLCFQERT